MIQDILNHNENIHINDKQIAALKEYFPACFSKDGAFDIERFKEEIKDKTDITSEGYELKFLGKSYAKLLASTETTTVIVPDEEHNQKPENKNSENIYISGDNLDGLKHLLHSYQKKIKCIYIDPPYNTGSDGFVYNDSFNYTSEVLQEKLSIGEKEAQRILDLTKRGSASHSAWLMFMYPRLLLARDLMTDDGVIFISIDDNEQANLKLLCDDIFGEENLIASFIIARSEGGGMAKQAVIGHDYLLVYSRNVLKFNPLKKPKDIRGKIVNIDGEDYWIEEDWLRKEFGKYGTCPYEEIEIFHSEEKKREIDEGLKKGEYVLINKGAFNIVGRYRKISEDGSKFYTIFKHLNKNGVDDLTELNMERFFSYPKPVSLLEQIILGATIFTKNCFDYILDFFSGSASTAHAVLKLNAEDGGNRRFIAVQLPEVLSDTDDSQKNAYNFLKENNYPTTLDYIGIERIKRAAAKIKEEQLAKGVSPSQVEGLDLGFKHYTLKEPEQNTLDKLERFDKSALIADTTVLDDFGAETVLATWLNDDGYGLTATAEETDLAGYKAYYKDKHLYFIYPDFTQEALQALITKFDTDGSFNPENIVLFGYSFPDWSVNEMVEKNLKILNDSEKNLKINYAVRY